MRIPDRPQELKAEARRPFSHDFFANCGFDTHTFLITVAAGMYPAQRAAEMTLVESLRHE